ncbi:beta-lactamase [Infirmifilum uzonense]|uniref:Beta-lactamase n=1 Tax=Infirmifilum uzonense TaxID=1550241 RepID=A0A0F7FJR2_9CREN|nr:MBL fold metallo-hydrolase [Infirmifilum uzonense]AKG39297.1 beta-lactamase [Infirmifilum uzonense]
MSKSDIVSVKILVLVDDYAGFTNLLAEHGLSIMASIEYRDGTMYKILFDTGQSGEVLLKNMQKLSLNPSEFDAIVLSHRHYDHTGGLVRLLESTGSKPVIAHPDIEKPNYADRGGFKKFNLGFTRQDIEALRMRGELVLSRKPLELAPNVWFLGEIPRVYDNSYAVKGFLTLEGGEIVPDQMLDDTGVAIKLGNKAVVLAGCSHSGISNIAAQAKRLTGVEELSIIGGLHTASATDSEVERIASELKALGVSELHAGHCTGFNGIRVFHRIYGEKLRIIHSGYRAIFV